jgi:hypothetical protein
MPEPIAIGVAQVEAREELLDRLLRLAQHPHRIYDRPIPVKRLGPVCLHGLPPMNPARADLTLAISVDRRRD